VIKRIHVFQAGEQTSSGGETRVFTPEILKEAAESYDPSVHEAPLVIGHSGDSDSVPSYGWVKKFHVEGESLYADVDFSDVAKELVENKHYKKVSISFYPPESKVNPAEGKWSVRHVALLGAAPPAVKGLEPFKFTENDGHLDFVSELTLESIVDDELGPSLDGEEGPLELLKEKLEDAKKEKSEKTEKEGETEKTEQLGEEMDSQTQESAGESSNSQFNEMATKPEEQEIESLEDSVSPEEIQENVDLSEEEPKASEEEEAEETPEEAEEEPVEAEPTADHAEGEEGEDEEMEEGEEEPKPAKPAKSKAKGAPKKAKKAPPMKEEEEEEEEEEFSEAPAKDPETEALLEEVRALRKEKEDLANEYREMMVRTRKEKLRDQVSEIYNRGVLTDAVIPQDDLTSFCEGLEFGTLEFSEGESAATKLISILERLPQMVEFREVVSEVKTEEMKFSELPLHEKALFLVEKESLSYEEALRKAVAMAYSS
jgi:hypothetical protein